MSACFTVECMCFCVIAPEIQCKYACMGSLGLFIYLIFCIYFMHSMKRHLLLYSYVCIEIVDFAVI